MENIFKKYSVGLRYDLKGSTQGRTRLRPNEDLRNRKDLKIALKDNDFIKFEKAIYFVQNESRK